MKLDSDEVRSYDQRAFFEKKESTSINPFSIFIAVLAAILVSWFIREAYMEWKIRQAVEIFNQQMQAINAQSQAQIRNIQLSSEASRAQMEREAELRKQEQEQVQIAKIQAENERRALEVAEIQARVNKEQAWKAFYKPTIGCEENNPNREAVICGNDYIKAHKRFEASWNSNTN